MEERCLNIGPTEACLRSTAFSCFLHYVDIHYLSYRHCGYLCACVYYTFLANENAIKDMPSSSLSWYLKLYVVKKGFPNQNLKVQAVVAEWSKALSQIQVERMP